MNIIIKNIITLLLLYYYLIIRPMHYKKITYIYRQFELSILQ